LRKEKNKRRESHPVGQSGGGRIILKGQREREKKELRGFGLWGWPNHPYSPWGYYLRLFSKPKYYLQYKINHMGQKIKKLNHMGQKCV
jgi:hypothetical protein